LTKSKHRKRQFVHCTIVAAACEVRATSALKPPPDAEMLKK
jgi:hypothetical protein